MWAAKKLVALKLFSVNNVCPVDLTESSSTATTQPYHNQLEIYMILNINFLLLFKFKILINFIGSGKRP